MQNFHVKSILLGIGIGIVLTAFISIIYSTGNKPVMSREEIIERAKQYGMVAREELIIEEKTGAAKGKDKPVENSGTEDVPAAAQENKEKAPDQKKSNDPHENDPAQSKEINKSGLDKDKKEAQSVKNSIEEDVTISILPGYTSEIVAQKLLESGLISDAKSFVDGLISMNLEGGIQVGDFKIKRGSSYSTIARIVTMTGS